MPVPWRLFPDPGRGGAEPFAATAPVDDEGLAFESPSPGEVATEELPPKLSLICWEPREEPGNGWELPLEGREGAERFATTGPVDVGLAFESPSGDTSDWEELPPKRSLICCATFEA
ncbi:MAG TPA: hypothetical protein DCE56_01840, partial [Cyanobacteria bacterium UBA8553]|nr:hypothetical protein [Cyanobacteria bacterium UBA8553]